MGVKQSPDFAREVMEDIFRNTTDVKVYAIRNQMPFVNNFISPSAILFKFFSARKSLLM
jgi:hypothetical protein